MVNLKVKQSITGRCWIAVEGLNDNSDKFVAEKIGFTYEEYIQILKDNGAFQYNEQYFFSTSELAQKCIDHLKTITQYKEYYESEESKPKPPLGVMSREKFERQRVLDLSRALYEYIDSGEGDYELLTKWVDELSDRIWGLKYASEEV